MTDLEMFSEVRLVEDYETEGYLLPKGKIGAVVERFSEEYCGGDYDDLRNMLVVPTRLLVPA